MGGGGKEKTGLFIRESKIIERVIFLSGSDILILGIVLRRSGESPSGLNWFIYSYWAMLWKEVVEEEEMKWKIHAGKRERVLYLDKENQLQKTPLPLVAPIFAYNVPMPSPSSTCSWSPICNQRDKYPFPYLCTNTTNWYTNGDRLSWPEELRSDT